MGRNSKEFAIVIAIAGVLFLGVGLYDLFGAVDKSAFVIGLELLAGVLFLLVAVLQRRKAL